MSPTKRPDPASGQVLPQWTEKLYRPSVGQDHLGLGGVSSDRILPQLAPGINVLTIHPRYSSFYAFVLDEFWRRELPRSYGALRDFYRPREAIFSIASQLCDKAEHDKCRVMPGVVGSRRTGRYAGTKPAAFDPNFNYMAADLGGYGLYYSTTMTAMGFVVPASTGTVPVDAPTPIGRAVADAYRKVIADTRYYRKYFDHPELSVPADVLLEYVRRGCLCQLHGKDALDAPLVQDLFLHGGNSADALSRRQSLCFVLDIADQTSGTPMDEDLFRQVIYYWPNSGAIKYEPRPDLLPTARRWRVYQAREYYSFALNRLWQHLCAWGTVRSGGGIRPVPLTAIWDHLNSSLDFKDTDLNANSSLSQLMTWVTKAAGPPGSLDVTWKRSKRITEHDLYVSTLRHEGDDVVPTMVSLLALLYMRLGLPVLATKYESEWELVREGGVFRLSLSRFLYQFRRSVMAGQTIGALTQWLVNDYVIRQHERVAMAKLPDDTFRFRREGNHVRFFALPAFAGMNNSRFQALSTTVSDLGLVSGLECPNHVLSKKGREFLECGDLPPLVDSASSLIGKQSHD